MIGLFFFVVLAPLEPWVAGKVVLTLVGGLFLLYDLRYRRPLITPEGNPLDAPVLLLLGFALCATVAATLASPTAWITATPWLPSFTRGDGFLIWVCYGLAALVASRLTSEEVLRLMRWLSIAGLIIMGVGIAQTTDFLLGRNIFDPTNHLPMLGYWITGPAVGTLGNPVFFGAWAALWAWITADNEAFWPGALTWLSVFASLSRAAMVGWAVSAMVRMRWLGLPAAIAASALALWASRHGFFASPLRLDLWVRTLHLIAVRPWGYGLNAFAVTFPGVSEPFWDNPHNELLYVAHAFGIGGFLCYCWVWWTALRRAPPALRAGLIGCGVALMFSWSAIGLANWLWVMLGLASRGGCDGRSHQRTDPCVPEIPGQ